MAGRYASYVARQKARHGDKFSEEDLSPHLREHFEHGLRVKVRTEYGGGEVHERTGTVGATTGWRPAFLLMHRSNAMGSSDVLGEKDKVVAVKRGRTYQPYTGPEFGSLFNDRRGK